MDIKLTKDIQSPFVERKKILPKGRIMTVSREIGKKLIKDGKAEPVGKNEAEDFKSAEKRELKEKMNKK